MSKVPVVRGRSCAAIAAKARAVLERYSPETLRGDAPFPIEQIIEFQLGDFDVTLDVQETSEGVEGSFSGGRLVLAPEVYAGLHDGQPRARFTASHELGHVILHKNEVNQMVESRQDLVLARRSDLPAYRDPEWQANEIAGCMLMPAEALQRIQADIKPQDDRRLVALVMRKMLVSCQAAETRVAKLRKAGQLK